MTLLELLLSMAIISVITMALAIMFKLAIVSNKLSTAETTLLFNARAALAGSGPYRGMIFDGLYASSMTAISASTLSLYNQDNKAVSYTLSSTNLLRTSGSATNTLAAGLSNLSFSYYNLDSSQHIMVSTVAANAAMATFSFQMSLPKRTVYLFSGASLRN